MDLLVQILMVHMGPRLLVLDDATSQPILTHSRSILAGCISSTRLAKAVLRNALLDASQKPTVQVGAHVDDDNQITITNSYSTTICDAYEAGIQFIDSAQKMGFTISDKSRVVANCPRMAQRLYHLFSKKLSVRLSGGLVEEDIGFATTAGRLRRTKPLKARIIKGRLKSRRVATLLKTNKKATKLFQTGVAPTQNFGWCSMGASPSQRRALRTNGRFCLQPAGSSASSTALYEWRGVGHYDPEIFMQAEHIRNWLQIWQTSSSTEKERITKAWHKTVAQLKQQGLSNKRWTKASGLMSGAICILLDNDWLPSFPDRWYFRPSGEETFLAHSNDKLFSNAAILDFFTRSVRFNLWKKECASGRGSCNGLDASPSVLGPAQRAKKFLQSKRQR